MLPLNELLQVFLFLDAKEVCRCAMVAGKWHRVSETPGIWTSLGVRRYRDKLQIYGYMDEHLLLYMFLWRLFFIIVYIFMDIH